MIISRSKTKTLIAVFTLLAFVWIMFTFSYYTHFHIDESGKIIVHAHPYQKCKNDNAFPIYSHSKSEYINLAFIYNILSSFVFRVFLVAFLLYHSLDLKTNTSPQWHPARIFRNDILKRGPPSLLQFVQFILSRKHSNPFGFNQSRDLYPVKSGA